MISGKDARNAHLQYTTDIQVQPRACVARVQDCGAAGNGAPPGVNINKPPKNSKDALLRIDHDAAEWVEAYRKEGQGFQDRDALEVEKPPKVTRPEHKLFCRKEKIR